MTSKAKPAAKKTAVKAFKEANEVNDRISAIAKAARPSKYVYTYRDSTSGLYCNQEYAQTNPATTQRSRHLRVSLPAGHNPDLVYDAPHHEPPNGTQTALDPHDDGKRTTAD